MRLISLWHVCNKQCISFEYFLTKIKAILKRSQHNVKCPLTKSCRWVDWQICLFLLLATMLLARQSWQKWVVRSRQINVRHCDVKVSSLTTYPPLEQITPTFWRKDKRSKNVAMIEQFWLRDTHLPPGETTIGRVFDVVPPPIVSQWELMLISIGVPDARGVKKQRMMPANAKEGTVFHRAVGESH